LIVQETGAGIAAAGLAAWLTLRIPEVLHAQPPGDAAGTPEAATVAA